MNYLIAITLCLLGNEFYNLDFLSGTMISVSEIVESTDKIILSLTCGCSVN
jgi:hypothetical protein